MDIPLPEEVNLSDDDDFDGYIDSEIEDEDGDGDDGNGNDSDGHDSEMVVMGKTLTKVLMGMAVKMVVMGKTETIVMMRKTVTMVLMEVLRFRSILGIQLTHKTWQIKIQ